MAGDREVRIRFTGESSPFKGVAGDVRRLFQDMQADVDDTRLAGDQLADAYRIATENMRRRMEDLESTASVLADSLGPEMVAAIEASGRTIVGEVERFERMGLTLDDIKVSSDQLGLALKDLDTTARQNTGSIGDGFKQISTETDNTRSVVANFTGNLASELPGVSGAFGPLNMAIGQFAEYATEGNIRLSNFLTAAGGLGAAVVGFQLLTMAIEAMGAEQREMDARTQEVVDSLADQIAKSYELATASGDAAGKVDGLRAAQEGLSAALLAGSEDGDKLQVSLGQLSITGKEAADTLIAIQKDPVAALTKLAIQAGLTEEAAARLAEKVAASDKPFWGVSEANAWLTDNLIATGKAMEELQDQAEKTSFSAIAEEYLNSAAAANDLSTELVRLAEANLGIDRNSDPVAVWEEYNRLLGEADAQTRDAVLGTNEYATALQAQEEALRLQEEAQRAATDAAAAAEAQTQSLLDAKRALIDIDFAVRQAQDQFTESLVALAEAADDPKTKVDEYRQALDSAAQAALAGADANVRQAEETAKASGVTLTAAEKNKVFVDSLVMIAGSLEPGSPLRVQLEGYITQLGRTDKASDIKGSVEISGVDKAIPDLKGVAKAAEDVKTETKTNSTAETQTAEERLADLKIAADNIPTGITVDVTIDNVTGAIGDIKRVHTAIDDAITAAGRLKTVMREITGR